MEEGLFYYISKPRDFCYIGVWFDSVEKSYSNEVGAIFRAEPRTESRASWSIQAKSYREMVRLLAVAHKFVVEPNVPGEQDRVDIGKLLAYLEETGCQVVKDDRLDKWVQVSEIEPGELWETDRETMTKALPARPFYQFQVLAEHEDQAKRRIASAISEAGEWNFLREWLDECLPVIRDTSKKAPEVITLDMTRQLLEAQQQAE